MLHFALAALLAAAPAPANPQVDYPGFRDLTAKIEEYRRTRLVDWKGFAAAAADPDVLILDARSASAFKRGHIKGGGQSSVHGFHRRKPRRRHRSEGPADPHLLQQQFPERRAAGAAEVGASRAQYPDFHQFGRLRLSQRSRAERIGRFQRSEDQLGSGLSALRSQRGIRASPRSSIRRWSTDRPSSG